MPQCPHQDPNFSAWCHQPGPLPTSASFTWPFIWSLSPQPDCWPQGHPHPLPGVHSSRPSVLCTRVLLHLFPREAACISVSVTWMGLLSPWPCQRYRPCLQGSILQNFFPYGLKLVIRPHPISLFIAFPRDLSPHLDFKLLLDRSRSVPSSFHHGSSAPGKIHTAPYLYGLIQLGLHLGRKVRGLVAAIYSFPMNFGKEF